MTTHLGVEEYERLIPIAKGIYDLTLSLSYQMLLPLFCLSIAFAYTTDLGISGAVLARIKRLVLVALLLVTFPMIAEFLQIFGVEIAKRIDDLRGIDDILEAASQRADSFTFNIDSLLNFGSNILLSALVVVSFLVLNIARYFLLAFQHFYWLLLVSLGPFLILASLFEAASGITRNLFRSMIQVACWPVIWAVLSAFLKALPFADIYAAEGHLITVVTLNFIIAVALLFSPFLVAQLTDGVSLSVGDSLRKGVLSVARAVNPKVAAVSRVTKVAGRFGKGFNA